MWGGDGVEEVVRLWVGGGEEFPGEEEESESWDGGGRGGGREEGEEGLGSWSWGGGIDGGNEAEGGSLGNKEEDTGGRRVSDAKRGRTWGGRRKAERTINFGMPSDHPELLADATSSPG